MEIKNLCKAYGDLPVLENVSFTAGVGVTALWGPSGVGKTTLLRILLGLEKPDSGELMGMAVRWSAVFQEDRLCETFSAVDNVLMTSPSSMSRAEVRRELMELLPEEVLDRPAATLSGGQKRRVAICRALCALSELLILDEPASGLDPRTRVEYTAILKELRDQGKTLLVSSHILSELSELCTSIGIIEQGRTVLQGSMDQIFARINSSNPLLISIFSQKEKALAILKSHPCVQTIAVQGDEIKLGFLGDRQDEALLLQQLIDADVMVSSFMREKGSLESLFMQITGHEEERAVLKHEMESGI